MSVQITCTQPWVDHNLYNEFPSVEVARNSISEQRQIEIGRVLGTFVPKLIKRFGTTLTHGHHGLEENESIVGELQGVSLVSKPRERTITVCPIAWVRTPEGLFATEAMDNGSEEVLRLVTLIEKNAPIILQHLPLEPDEKFSKLTVIVDPRVICNTNDTYFIEKNDKDGSVLSSQSEKRLDISQEKIIPTYKSIDSFQDSDQLITTWCCADCLPYQGNHYYSHMRE